MGKLGKMLSQKCTIGARIRRIICLSTVLVFLVVVWPANAQTTSNEGVDENSQAVDSGTAAQDSRTLLRGFRNLQLGLSFSETQTVLRQDSAFNYRGPEDVSLRLSDRQSVIDSPGRGFVERVLLQFHNDRLYIITLYLNQSRLDYFQIFDRLNTRYGAPTDLTPQLSTWEDSQTRITLERPLRVQYLDLPTFRSIRDTSRIEEAVQTELRKEFLDAF